MLFEKGAKMKRTIDWIRWPAFGALAVLTFVVVPRVVRAHCDTLDGPVVKDARGALSKGDVTSLLKWVAKEDEKEIQAAFQKTLAVRKLNPEAKDLADMYFFETLVRIHRAAEGAPYTGLKSSVADLDPAVAAADKALETGSVDELAKEISHAVENGIKQRFQQTIEAKKHSDASVETGREYVEAYVQFVHYVERLHQDAVGVAIHESTEKPQPKDQHLH